LLQYNHSDLVPSVQLFIFVEGVQNIANFTLKIGSKIIDSEQIYTISDIKNDVIYYKSDDNCSCSIPVKNLSIACIRPLMSKEDITLIFKNLSEKESLNPPSTTKNNQNNNNYFGEILYSNNPSKICKLLVYFNQLEKNAVLTKSDQVIYDRALNHLANEISVVSKVPLNLTKNKILSIMGK